MNAARKLRVLLIDEDARVPTAIRNVVTTGSARSWSFIAASPARALRNLLTGGADLIVTEALSAIGLEIVRAIRAIPSNVLVFAYSSNGWSEQRRADVLYAGADSILSAPLENRAELVAWFEAAARRLFGTSTATRLRVGPLELDAQLRRVRVRGVESRTTRDQFAILFLLASRAPQVVSFADLSRALGYEHTHSPHALSEAIRRLRGRIGREVAIEAVTGVGYRFFTRADEAMTRTANVDFGPEHVK